MTQSENFEPFPDHWWVWQRPHWTEWPTEPLRLTLTLSPETVIDLIARTLALVLAVGLAVGLFAGLG